MDKTNIRKNQKKAAGEFFDKYSCKVGILLLTVAWPIITLCLKPLIERLGDLSLFIYNTEFFNQKVFAPAGMLDYVCSFLNQLLFTPWLATLLQTALFLAIYVLTIRFFELKKGHTLLALIPIALLICTIIGYGENIYFLTNQNIFYTSTIGFLFALCIAACCKKCNKCLTCTLVTIVLAGTTGYLIAGTYALLGIAMFAALSVVGNGAGATGNGAGATGNGAGATNKLAIAAGATGNGAGATGNGAGATNKLAIAAGAILTIAIFPLFFYKQYIAGMEFVNFATFNHCNTLPFIILAVVSIALAFARYITDSKPILELLGIIAACAIAIVGSNRVDRQFATELKMFAALEKEDFDKVFDLYNAYADKCNTANKKGYSNLKKNISGQKRTDKVDKIGEYYQYAYKTPSRTMSQFRLIALGRTGQTGSKLFSSLTGELDRNSKLSFSTMLYEYGPTIFNNWGIFSSAYVWASGNSIHSGWNYYNLKEAVIALMLKGDNELAGKYIDILSATKIYRKWATEQKQYIQTGTANTNSKYHYMQALNCPRENQYISSSKNIESFLINHFSLWKTQPEKITPEYANCALLWSIYSQQIPEFWTAFNNYLDVAHVKQIPRYYQEAAYLYASLEYPAFLKIIPFDKEVINRYKEFDKFAQRNNQLTAVEMRNECYKKFGDTFFYFYFFVRNFL